MGTDTGTPNETHPQYNPHDRRPQRGRQLVLGGAGAAALCVAVVAALSVFGAPSAANTAGDAPAAVQLTVTSPTSGSVIASDQVNVTGTVSPANATVTIQNHAAAVGDGVFTGNASLRPGKTTIDVIASAPNAAPVSTTVIVSRPGAARHHHSNPPTVGPATTALPAPTSDATCGDGLTAGPNTTCPFAENVRVAYEQTGPGAVTVYSPVTNATYQMSCSYGPSVVCTGGNNASVYFTTASSPSYQSPPSYGVRDCGAGLEAGPHTTCPFAENVRSAFESSGPGTVDVYSPVTHDTYAMSCTDGSPAVCTGGNGAAVYIH
jgi:hypothetical protein